MASPPRPLRTREQAPRLAIDFKHSLALRPVVKVNRRSRNKRLRRNHIPQVSCDHIRCQKIDVIQRIKLSASRCPRVAPSASMAGRALHLHPPQPPPTLHRKVIRTAISPRLQHRKAQHRSLRQKRSLYRLPQRLARGRSNCLYLNQLPLPHRIRFFTHKKSAAEAAPYLLTLIVIEQSKKLFTCACHFERSEQAACAGTLNSPANEKARAMSPRL